MKKIKQIISLATLGVLSTIVLSQSVEATEVEGYPKTGNSDAIIQFKPGNDKPGILDPEDPTQPFDPNNPSNPDDEPTGDTGPLTLDYVSSINFGENEISAEDKTYKSTTLQPFIQVTDRRGTGEGWHVTAKASAFTSEDTKKQSLTGSSITFANGAVHSNNITPTKPTANKPVVLGTGTDADAKQIVNAPADTGLGSWITHWFNEVSNNEEKNDSVTLKVPAGVATQGKHTATIDWTLSNVPGQ